MVAQKKRYNFIDFIKTISIIMVLITHTNISSYTRNKYNFQYSIDMAVPLFMIITGFTYTLSYRSRTILGIREWFFSKNFIDKLLRITPSFLIILLLEITYAHIYYGYSYSQILADIFAYGAYGQGGYYYWVLLQIVIAFPFMLYILNKDYIGGSIMLLSVQLLSEILIQANDINVAVYRLMFIRYIVFVWLGITLFYYRDKLKILPLMLLAGWSLLYLYSVCHGWVSVSLFAYWTGTSMPTAFYPFLFVVLCYIYYDKIIKNDIVDKIFKTIGQSTYHIFLIQMLYYFTPISNNLINALGIKIALVINITSCLFFGVIFFKAEEKIRKINVL